MMGSFVVDTKCVGERKRLFPRSSFLPLLFLGLSWCLNTSLVEAVAAASEWPIGVPDEYTMAVVSFSYRARNGTTISEKSQSARFGKGGKIGSTSGVVIHVESIRNGTRNHFGCEPLINAIPPHEPWIALVRRGSCDFDVKLTHAYERKAAGMVVYDREESETLEDMKLSAYTIPGVFTYKAKGERLANLSDAGIRVDLYISIGEVCTRPYAGVNRTSVLFVSISFIVLMAISLAWLAFYYVQRFRYLHAKDRLARRLCNAAKKALAKIPTRSVNLTDKEVTCHDDGECCAVCIDFYKAGDMLRTLPCRHEFHKLCVDPWLLEHRTCPMCKMDILKHYGYIFTGSQESILHLDEDATLNSSADESREEDTDATADESQIHTHHQHHRIVHHPTDSLSLSSPTSATVDDEDGFPSMPHDDDDDDEDMEERREDKKMAYQATQEEVHLPRKPSLISLTVTASPNGCIITAPSNTTPSCTVIDFTPANSSTTTDCLLPTITSNAGMNPADLRSLSPAPPTLLKASLASPHDSSTVITSLVNTEYPHHPHPMTLSSSSLSQPPKILLSSSLLFCNKPETDGTTRTEAETTD